MTADRPALINSCDMAKGPDLTSMAEIVNGRVINVRHVPRQDRYDPTTLAGAIKLRAWDCGIPLTRLAPLVGMKPDSLRQRLSKTRGKRALQPWQVTKLARALGLEEAALHRLAAKHEGWKV